MLAITGEFGRFEEFFSEVVYPAWPLWAVAAAAATIGVAYLAYARGWHRAALRHPLMTSVALAAVLAVAAPAGYYTLSPLFERSVACEANPLAGAGAGSDECDGRLVATGAAPTPRATPATAGGPTAPTTAATPELPFEARVASMGEFHGADEFHFGRGKALLVEAAPGQYVLRFEEFSVRNGPDLYVYLSADAEGYGEQPLELGTLKATDGAFNYEVPAGTDVSRFKSALVWCRQFAVLFAVAPFMPA